MFGRAGELAALTAAWNAARDGHGRVVLVTGEAGIGKTRLVAELARRADNAGARVAVGAGVDVGGEAPLAVWQELARALVAVVPVPPEAAAWPAELGRLSPDLAGALGRRVAPPVVAAPELERLRLFDAVLRLVEFAASGSPVLLVAEDLHRADRASLALCAHIGRRLARLPVLFVLTRRDRPTRPEADALLADLAGRGLDVAEIDLGPLRGQEVAEVARSVAMLADADLARVVAAADGNPLLAVESTRALAAGSTAPPSSLRAVVRSALAALSEPARNLAEAVAAAGRTLSASEIAALPVTADSRARGARNGAGPPRPGRPRLPARAARRGGPRRPARPGGHPSPGGARRRGGGRARATSGPPRSPATCSGPVATTSRRRAGSGRPGTPARSARCPRPPRSGTRPCAATRTTSGCGWSSPRPTAWLGQHRRVRARVGGRRSPGSRPASRPPPGAGAGCCSRPSPATRPPRSRPTGARDELLPADAPAELRARVLIGLAWNEASAGDPARSEPLLAEAAALHPGTGRRDRRRDRDRAADRRDPARPVRRMRGAGAAGRGRARPRAAARLRLRRLDHDRVRAGVRGRPRRRAAHRRPGGRGHPRRPGGRAALPGRARPPAVAAGPPRRGGRAPSPNCSHGRAAGLTAPARASPATTPGSSPSPRAAPREAADADRRRARRRRGRQPSGRPAGPGRGAGRRRRAGRGRRPSCAARRWSRSGRPTSRGPSCRRWRGCRASSPGPGRPRGGAAATGRVGRGLATARGRARAHAGDEYMAALVDLGRPPVVGLVEPAWELRARHWPSSAELEETCPGSR